MALTVERAKEIRFWCDGWIAAFEIFKRYDTAISVSGEHDVIYAGPEPADVSDEDKAVLEALGWYSCEQYECFSKNT